METLNCKNEIVNRALSLLREKEIIDASIEPSSDTEKLVYKWYETAKAECIMEIEPAFAIRRLKLNAEKAVNAETLEEIKETKNKEIDFEDWIKSVVESDVAELQNAAERLREVRKELDDELLDELNKVEQNEEQIKYIKRRVRHINLNIVILNERIKFMREEYNLTSPTPAVEQDLMILNFEEETPATPLIPAQNELLGQIARRKKVMFYKDLKRREQIRRYEEYEAWKEYCSKNQKQKPSCLYAYRIPTDCLKIFNKDFVLLEGNYIYSYLDNGFTIQYLSNAVELYGREVKFNIALSYLLAYYICADLQNSDDKIQLFFGLKNNKISEARISNLRETGVEIVKKYRWEK